MNDHEERPHFSYFDAGVADTITLLPGIHQALSHKAGQASNEKPYIDIPFEKTQAPDVTGSKFDTITLSLSAHREGPIDKYTLALRAGYRPEIPREDTYVGTRIASLFDSLKQNGYAFKTHMTESGHVTSILVNFPEGADTGDDDHIRIILGYPDEHYARMARDKDNGTASMYKETTSDTWTPTESSISHVGEMITQLPETSASIEAEDNKLRNTGVTIQIAKQQAGGFSWPAIPTQPDVLDKKVAAVMDVAQLVLPSLSALGPNEYTMINGEMHFKPMLNQSATETPSDAFLRLMQRGKLDE